MLWPAARYTAHPVMVPPPSLVPPKEPPHGVPPAIAGRDRYNVRFGSLADIRVEIGDVRFTSESRHAHRRLRCPLSANSRHSVSIEFILPAVRTYALARTRTRSNRANSYESLPHRPSMRPGPGRRLGRRSLYRIAGWPVAAHG